MESSVSASGHVPKSGPRCNSLSHAQFAQQHVQNGAHNRGDQENKDHLECKEPVLDKSRSKGHGPPGSKWSKAGEDRDLSVTAILDRFPADSGRYLNLGVTMDELSKLPHKCLLL